MALSRKSGGVQSAESESKMSGVGGTALSGLMSELSDFASKEQLKNQYVRDASTVSGQAVFNSFKRKKDRTFQDLLTAQKLSKSASEEERAIKSNQQVESNININALSNIARNLYNISKGGTSFLGTTTKNDIEDEVEKQNKEEIDRKLNSPAVAAIDRLGIQDYFPTIQDDIAVGTYSGRRLGSVTLFAAPGFVVPTGMIEARKRALVETAKNKQKALDSILEIPDAPEQLNREYKQKATEAIYAIAAKHNYDPNAIMRDKDAMAQIYRWQTTAEELVNVDTQIDELIANHIDKDGNISYHIPKDALEFMYGFRAGRFEDMDDYLSGKKNISEKLLKIKTLADGTRMVDRNMASILANPRELPINLKTGVQIDEAALNEIEAARKKISGGVGYDSYLEVIKKYYDINVDQMVDSWMTKVGYDPDDEARKWVKEYAQSRIPAESLTQEITNQNNQNFEYYKLRKQREWEKEDKMAFWEMTLKKFEDGAVNKAISDAQAAIDAETDPNKKATLLANAYNYLEEQYGAAFKVQKDQNDPGNVYGVISVDRNTQLSEAVVSNNRLKLYVKNRTWDRNKNKWVETGDGEWVFFDDFKRETKVIKDQSGKPTGVSYGKYFPVVAGSDASGNGNPAFNLDVAETIEFSQKGNLNMSAYEHHVQAGWVEGGNRYKVRTNNVRKYKDAKEQTLFVQTLANPIIETGTDDEGNPIIKESQLRLRWESDLEETSDRQTLEVISSSKQQNKSGFSGRE